MTPAAAFHAGRKVEREQCAKLVEKIEPCDLLDYDARETIAEAIRKRA